MKKNLILIVLLILCLKFSLILAACNNSNETDQPITDEDLNFDNNDNEDLIPSNGNILVAYFSWSASSNTERMATYIAEQTNAILYEIEPLVPYPTEYTPTTEVAAQEKEENARPKIKNPIDISNFDYIFVGFPIWWHTAPMIIGTFLESYNLDSKDIYPFFKVLQTTIAVIIWKLWPLSINVLRVQMFTTDYMRQQLIQRKLMNI